MTQKTRTILRRVVIVCSIILAVAFVTTVTVDLGPPLRNLAEEQGTRFLDGRRMHIGRLSVRLWNGKFQVHDLMIDGLEPTSPPFFTAKRIDVGLAWGPMLQRRVVLDNIEMSDWRMVVEQFPDGRHSFPKFRTAASTGPRRWTTTLSYVRAYRGEFTFNDYGTPWGIVAPNIDVTVARPGDEYVGTAKFSNGLTTMMNYVPFRTDMESTFTVDSGRLLMKRIDLRTPMATSVLRGDVNLNYWPEQMFEVKSTIDFPKAREIFFANDTFTLSGTGYFDGFFHLFREPTPEGPSESRISRELKGTFSSAVAGVNQYRFPNLRGDVRWSPETLAVTNATADAYGGRSRFTYTMSPLNRRGVPATMVFDTEYESVSLSQLSDLYELEGLRLAGTINGRNRMEWRSGRFGAGTWEGRVQFVPPAGAQLASRQVPADAIEARAALGEPVGPFSSHTPLDPVPIGGEIVYERGPEWIDIGPSRIATPETYVEFEGRTAYGERSRIPFHVTSWDWQESDRVFAGLLTALGSPTNAIPIGGYGTFDGVLFDNVRRPRIEGMFAGERMRAFDVVWGSARGTAVIENNYADVKDVVITSGDSTVHTDGRYSIGFPRRDGGEEIDARVRIIRRPIADLRHAFGLDDYDLDGTFSGEFRVYGSYLTPYGFGTMGITDGVAYGEPFDTAIAGVRLEGQGVTLDNIQIVKGNGRATGAAYVGWNGTYSFNLDARNMALESLALTSGSTVPLSGLLDFTAGGSGTFEQPKYDVRGTLRDFFVADEGIGQVIGDLNIDGKLLTLKLEAASARLAVSGAGKIALTPEMDAELSFSVADTSLDPYIRAFQPQLSPYTTAIASGNIRVVGELANIDQLVVDTTVDRLDVRLFDYAIRNAAPIRLALDRHSVRIQDMRLVGQDTQLDVSGFVNLHDERIAVRATGDANLGILQGFVSNIRSSGRAALKASFEGPMRDPLVSGTMTIEGGRIRHFGLPHALENIGGVVRFDTRTVRLDEVTARLGNGDVRFGGAIGIDGYRLGRLDVTMDGTGMRLRFPEGMRSLVDAQLALEGTPEAATLSGNVLVRDAVYEREFEGGGNLLDLTAGGPAGVAASAPTTTIPLRYQVRITAPSTLQVDNNTFRLVASANLDLIGTYDRPLLAGRAEVQRGEIIFEGRRYRVTRGTIDFNNPTRIEPYLDVEAETNVRVPGETYRITIRATGTPDRLTPVFDADPPLPEYEVLALLFGGTTPGEDPELRQFTTGVTSQQALLTERAARLVTGVVSSEVGRVVEQTFGVDTFQLTPSLVDPNQQSSRLDPAARITIGKRLSDRIYLTYSRSLSSSTRDQIILLEFDQTDRYSWILSRNEDGTYALDVRLRRTF